MSIGYAMLSFRLTIKIASEVGAQMKLTFGTLMLHALNFGSNSVERSRSAVAVGIQSSDFVRQIAIEAFPDDLIRRTKCKFNGPGNIFLTVVFIKVNFLKKGRSSPLTLYAYPLFENQATNSTFLGGAGP